MVPRGHRRETKTKLRPRGTLTFFLAKSFYSPSTPWTAGIGSKTNSKRDNNLLSRYTPHVTVQSGLNSLQTLAHHARLRGSNKDTSGKSPGKEMVVYHSAHLGMGRRGTGDQLGFHTTLLRLLPDLEARPH
jgi:hypothetical protein